MLILLGGVGLAYGLSRPSHPSARKDIAKLTPEPDVFTIEPGRVDAPLAFWPCRNARVVGEGLAVTKLVELRHPSRTAGGRRSRARSAPA
jgi:hypothetical protein